VIIDLAKYVRSSIQSKFSSNTQSIRKSMVLALNDKGVKFFSGIHARIAAIDDSEALGEFNH